MEGEINAIRVALGLYSTHLPASELRALAREVDLPAGAVDRWDVIGTYTLKEGKTSITIKLYSADTDSASSRSRTVSR